MAVGGGMRATVVAMLVALAAACATTGDPTATVGATPSLTPGAPDRSLDVPEGLEPDALESQLRATGGTAAAAGRRTVVIVSIDGFNPGAVGELGRQLVVLPRLLREGVSTLNARTSVESTETLPNHSGMLTGRPVRGDMGTGVTFNEDNGATLASVHGSYVSGVFDVVHDHGLRTALFAQKDKFHFLERSWDASHGAADTVGEDDGRDKVDIAEINSGASQAARVAATVRGGEADLLFWHLRAPDTAGHAHGWMSAAYLSAVRRVDADLSVLLGALDSDAAAARRTTIVLTADHGGVAGAHSHGDHQQVADYRIPFVVWGAGVRGPADLYRLNPRRQQPGDGQPSYAGAQPVRNLDAAGIALDLLGLPPLEESLAATWPPLNIGR